MKKKSILSMYLFVFSKYELTRTAASAANSKQTFSSPRPHLTTIKSVYSVHCRRLQIAP